LTDTNKVSERVIEQNDRLLLRSLCEKEREKKEIERERERDLK